VRPVRARRPAASPGPSAGAGLCGIIVAVAVRTDRRIVAVDPAFGPLVAAVGPAPERAPVPAGDRFPALVSAVVSQLLSVAAARTIHARVVAACDGGVEPASVLRVGAEGLRSVGLSRAKAATLTDLADRVLGGAVRPAGHDDLDDAEVAAELTAVPGIGPWTTHVYLIFSLARPDVWPVGDLGVRRGWGLVHHSPTAPTARELATLGQPHAGHRSAVAWYCWQAVHRDRGDI